MCNYRKVLLEKQASFWNGISMMLDFEGAALVRKIRLFSRNNSNLIGSLLIGAFLAHCSGNGPAVVFSTPAGPKRLVLELARTEAERNRGLMFRSRLEEGRGMLFIFEEAGRPAFWMKNTYLSLDILFLSDDGEVVDLFERLPPCALEPCPRYAPGSPVRYVLEVNAGFVARHSVRKGDRVRFERLPGDLFQ